MRYTLDELFLFIRNGANIKQGQKEGYPITRIETIANKIVDRNKMGYADIFDIAKYERYILQDDDILMSHINSVKHLGKTAIFKKSFTGEIVIHGMNLLCLRPNKKLLIPKYIYYYFNSNVFLRNLIKYVKNSVNQASIAIRDLKKMELEVPSIENQKKIVTILDKVSNSIELRKQQIEALSALKQSIFLDMFGDPLKSKEEKFEDIIIELRYGTSTPPAFSETGYKFIRATNIKLGQINEDDMLFISEEEANKIEKCKLELGDLIFVRSGVNSGDNAIVTEEYVGHYGAYDIIVKPNQKVVNPYYLNTLFNSHYLDLIIKPLTRRAGQPHINAKQIKSLKLFVPPIDLQKQYEIKVKAIIQQINKLNGNQKELTLLYDSLLYKAFNGELFKEDIKV